MIKPCLIYDSSFLPNGKQTSIIRTIKEAQIHSFPPLTTVQISNLSGINYPETLYQLKTLELAKVVKRVGFSQSLSDTNVRVTAWVLCDG